MPVTFLNQNLYFPDCSNAEESGLLAIGGDLSRDRLLLAYRSGIFPWFAEYEEIQWWCPDPRFVLFPENIYVSKSMKQVLKSSRFAFSVNRCFEEVIHNCAHIRRREGTWITDEMIEAYCDLHHAGYAVSAEAWANETLVGGLYGIRIGNVFFGESMFSKVSNASKFAFIQFTNQLKKEGVVLIDCQVYTEHLESLGAEFISRNHFMQLLREHL
jgi:leucyl/phenylalanyl-tRNA--protein transferase